MTFINSCKKPVGIGLITAGALSVLYSMIAKAYHVSFSGFFLPLGLLLVAAGILKLVLKPFRSKIMKFFLSAFRIIIFLGLLSFIIVEGLILGSAFKKDKNKPDYIVVLGAGLWGERPSLVLQQRLNTSLALIRLYPDVKIIVSGGQGPGETISEAEAMKRFLIKRGTAESRILIEDKSTSTLENLSYTKNLISKIDNRKNITVTIITNNFHMFRSKFLAGRVGLKALGYPAPLKLYLVPAYYIREYFGVIKSALLDFPSKVMPQEIGLKIDSYKGVAVYNNGRNYARSYGKNYSKDGYYYGYKWQCVEFIKRFFYDAKDHKMPDGFGNAKDFFNGSLPQGEFNKARGLYQYRNGEDVRPEQDDLIVFTDTKYGHVAIVTEVGKDYVEIIQQNIYNTPRTRLPLVEKYGKYFVGSKRKPAGWLRKK